MRWAEHGTSRGRVEVVEPPRRFAYRWAAHGSAAATSRPRATRRSSSSRSRADGDGTRLRVVESGFAALALGRAARRRNHDDNVGGWKAGARRARPTTRAGGGLTADALTGGLRRAGRPDALARAHPDRRARRGDRDDAGRRAAGQPRRGRQAPRGARPRRARRGAPRRAARCATRSGRAARRHRALDGRPRLAVGRPARRDQADGRGRLPLRFERICIRSRRVLPPHLSQLRGPRGDGLRVRRRGLRAPGVASGPAGAQHVQLLPPQRRGRPARVVVPPLRLPRLVRRRARHAHERGPVDGAARRRAGQEATAA